MVDRVLIGDHPSFGMGLYVSQPSINVNTANKFQMAWSTIFEQFQIVTSGSAAIEGGSISGGDWSSTFTWSNLGYYPIILVSCDAYEIELEYLSTSSARMRRAATPTDSGGGTSDSTAYFIVTRSIKP